jgi:hypothetical protein
MKGDYIGSIDIAQPHQFTVGTDKHQAFSTVAMQ